MNRIMTFKEAVEKTPDCAGGYRDGLKAIKNIYTGKIKVSKTLELNGSVDIDSCTQHIYSKDKHWDYAFSYREKTYFVEFHSAISSEVKPVLRKLEWLKNWLRQHAPEIDKLKAKQPYFWVQSSGFHIPKTAPQYKEVAKAGLMPIPRIIEQDLAG
jgi:hypothetical protein